MLGESCHGKHVAVSRSLPPHGFNLLDNTPIFRTKGFKPKSKGGRPRLPVPHTKNSLIDDFADVQRTVFGPDEKCRLMDMRRTGAVEANAGGASVEAIPRKWRTASTRTESCKNLHARKHHSRTCGR
jgi:hypothetical protein